MKRIALFMLLLFTLVQVLPAMNAVVSDGAVVAVFNPDEEKNGETSSSLSEIVKEKKAEPAFVDHPPLAMAAKKSFATCRNAGTLPAPVSDLSTPPPNAA